ncbi:MAG: hypothetical protein H0W53_02245 [Acidobacteria bacterium]|nr:hypothetical protein [Acidobacteriota bacterium]
MSKRATRKINWGRGQATIGSSSHAGAILEEMTPFEVRVDSVRPASSA